MEFVFDFCIGFGNFHGLLGSRIWAIGKLKDDHRRLVCQRRHRQFPSSQLCRSSGSYNRDDAGGSLDNGKWGYIAGIGITGGLLVGSHRGDGIDGHAAPARIDENQ